MTRPDPLREMAKNIAEEWCIGEFTTEKYEDFVPSLEQALRTAYRQGKKDAYDKMRLGVAIDMEVQEARAEGYRQGQESMRERAAKVADGFNTEYFMMRIHLEHGPVNETIAEAIRALDPETEGKP